MAQFKVFKSALTIHKKPILIGEVWETDLDVVKDTIRNAMGVNPFYTIILDVDNQLVVHNEFIKFTVNYLNNISYETKDN